MKTLKEGVMLQTDHVGSTLFFFLYLPSVQIHISILATELEITYCLKTQQKWFQEKLCPQTGSISGKKKRRRHFKGQSLERGGRNPRGPGTMETLVVFEEVDMWGATLIGRASHPITPQIAKEKMTRP